MVCLYVWVCVKCLFVPLSLRFVHKTIWRNINKIITVLTPLFLVVYVHCMYRVFLAVYVLCTMYIVQGVVGCLRTLFGCVFTLYNVYCTGCFWPFMYIVQCMLYWLFWPRMYIVHCITVCFCRVRTLYRLFLALYVHSTGCFCPCMYIVQVVSGLVCTLYKLYLAVFVHCTMYTVQGVSGHVCTRFFLALFYKHCTPVIFLPSVL